MIKKRKSKSLFLLFAWTSSFLLASCTQFANNNTDTSSTTNAANTSFGQEQNASSSKGSNQGQGVNQGENTHDDPTLPAVVPPKNLTAEQKSEINNSLIPITTAAHYQAFNNVQLPNFSDATDQKVYQDGISRVFSLNDYKVSKADSNSVTAESATAWVISKASTTSEDWTYYVGTNMNLSFRINNDLHDKSQWKDLYDAQFFFGVSPLFAMNNQTINTPASSDALLPNTSSTIKPILNEPFLSSANSNKTEINLLPITELTSKTVWSATNLKFTNSGLNEKYPVAKALDFAVLKISFNSLKKYYNTDGSLKENGLTELNKDLSMQFSATTVKNVGQWLANLYKLPDLKFHNAPSQISGPGFLANKDSLSGYLTGFPKLNPEKPLNNETFNKELPQSSGLGFVSLKTDLNTLGLYLDAGATPTIASCDNFLCTSLYNDSTKTLQTTAYYGTGVAYSVKNLSINVGSGGSLVLNDKGEAIGIYSGQRRTDGEYAFNGFHNIFNSDLAGQITWFRAQGMYDMINQDTNNHTLCDALNQLKQADGSAHVPSFCS